MTTVADTVEQKELSTAKRRLLEQRMRGGRVAERIAAREPGARVPVSTEQHRVWLHAAMEPDVPIYNESLTVHRTGSFDAGVFEAAFNEVIRRHEAWRTSFTFSEDGADGELVQVVAPELHVSLLVTDLRGIDEEKREAEACRIATELAAEPIDMATAPLLRARVLRMSDEEHRLQLCLHHIIFDGVSLYRTFMPELAAIYAAFEAGEDSPLPASALQYGDYTLWRERQTENAELTRQMEYWAKNLAGELPVLRLPIDKPRPAARSHRGAVLCFQWPEELMARLRALSRECGVSLNMTILAAFKTLLFRYGGQEDLIVGGLADGRRRPELEGVMGYFLDTFAIRTRPRAELPFAQYLGEVSHAALGAMAASEVPFSRVVAAVQPAREHHPIFQTFMAFQPRAEVFAEGWELTKTNVEAVAAKFDLYVEVDERLDWTAVRLMYRTDLFAAATIGRMAGHWTTLLEGIVERPNAPLGDLPLLTEAEGKTMLVQWNDTAWRVPMETVHGAVSAQACRTPDAVAVEFEGACWSYAELEREAGRLAEQLRRAGAGHGTLVAVCLERSQWLPAALLAILKTGAAYLPLDPGTPKARRELCLEDASPAVVLTERGLLGDLPKTSARVVVLEEALAAGGEWEAGDETASLNDAAYVIHTSGSTGRPKGVEISHRAMVNLLTSMAKEPGFGTADVLLAVTTVSFDIAGLELFLPLVTGGKCVIAPRAVALDPVLLSEAVERTGCTVLQATPSTWRALLGSGWRGRKGLRALCGGEAMTRDLADGLLALGLEVWNVYGPTETTVWSTVQRVTAGAGPVSVGRPIANTTTYILDARQQPVPIGVAGELYIGGMGLANGYRGQPELTAAKFVVPEWLGKRVYRTGDYALYRADGTIEVQGRADNQVKVRGYRIELEDVESALMRHPDVGMAAAKAWPDAAGGHRLSAYLVGRAGVRPPDAGALREFLKARVPEYMIPSDVVALDAMPLTPNGKMDRKALLAPVVTEERVVAAVPASETERRLAGVWAELLRVHSVGMEENFFDLGGHSLLVARLQQRIAEEFGRRLPMAALYHAPTLRRQVAMLADSAEVPGSVGNDPRILAIQPEGTKKPLFWLEPTPLIRNLSEALGIERPLLGVALLHGDLDDLGPKPSLQAIARCYVDTITRAHTGPYLLGGLCVGGILAYEVAVQLTALGHTVESLVMLDAENPVFYRRFDSLGVELAKIKFYAERAVFGNGAAMFWRHVFSRTRRLLRVDGRASTEMSELGNVILSAAMGYAPPGYAKDVLLVIPRERPSVVDYVPGWRAVVEGELICVEVDGHHDELLTPAFSMGIAEAVLGHLAKGEGV